MVCQKRRLDRRREQQRHVLRMPLVPVRDHALGILDDLRPERMSRLSASLAAVTAARFPSVARTSSKRGVKASATAVSGRCRPSIRNYRRGCRGRHIRGMNRNSADRCCSSERGVWVSDGSARRKARPSRASRVRPGPTRLQLCHFLSPACGRWAVVSPVQRSNPGPTDSDCGRSGRSGRNRGPERKRRGRVGVHGVHKATDNRVSRRSLRCLSCSRSAPVPVMRWQTRRQRR
jgi:hypothetical protein